MNIKNINPLEQHVEKIVLLVAVLFAAWLIYGNFVGNPYRVAMPDQPAVQVTPGSVGPKIVDAANVLRQLIRSSPPYLPLRHPLHYVKQVRRAELHPLSPRLVAMPQVVFGPLNRPIGQVVVLPGLANVPNVTYVVPAVPAPMALKAHQHRGVTTGATPTSPAQTALEAGPSPPQFPFQPGVAPGQFRAPFPFRRGGAALNFSGNGVAPPATGKPKDIAWIKVSAEFPMAQWLADLAGGSKLKAGVQGLPATFQRTTFYRVQARRAQLQPDGQWGPWQRVHGFYFNALPVVHLSQIAPAARAQALDTLDQNVGNILTPAFYPLQKFQLQVQPAGQPMNQSLMPPLPGAMIPGAPGGYGTMGSMPRMRTPRLPRLRRNYAPMLPPALAPPSAGVFPGAAGSVPSASAPGAGTSVAALSKEARIPIWFYDTTVQPGRTYRYELRLVLFNPTYDLPWHLTVASAAQQPWLKSPWSRPSGAVHASNKLYFYLVPDTLARSRVEFRIFKWVQGLWAVGEQTVSPGELIGNTQVTSLLNSRGQLAPKQVDFNTGYTLVNVAANANGDIAAVVLAPEGRLQLRHSAWDVRSSRQKRLMQAVVREGTPKPAPPGTTLRPPPRPRLPRFRRFRGMRMPGGD